MISDSVPFVSADIEKFKLPDHSGVWVFQADRFLTPEESVMLETEGNRFAAAWQAHGKQLTAQFVILDHLFAVMAVDEQQESASGCSIDKFMRFILQAEQKLSCSLTNRMCFAFLGNAGIVICKRHEIQHCIAQYGLNPQTLVFDNLVPNLGELRRNRLKPASETWLAAAFG
jgi:hypothetical protein